MELYLLLLLQVADAVSTILCLKNPRLQESNQLLKELFNKLGIVSTLVLIKGGYAVICWLAVPYAAPSAVWIIIAAYVWVVFNNIKLLLDNG